MRILIISFTDLSKREEREKCNEKAFVLVHPMPCCLFRWGFSIEFDLRTRKLPENKWLGKCSLAPSDARAGGSWETEGKEQLQRG